MALVALLKHLDFVNIGAAGTRLMSQNPFADQPVKPDIVRFVSVLSARPRSVPSTPM